MVKRKRNMVWIIIVAVLVSLVIFTRAFTSFAPQFGAAAKGDRLLRMQKSANFKNGIFQNLELTPMSGPESSALGTMGEFMKKHEGRVPKSEIPFQKINPQNIGNAAKNDLKVTWIGHSTLLIEIAGKVFLTDPVFRKTVSPMMIFGPKSYQKQTPISVDEIPNLDAIILSHDHYDHMDYKTILKLKEKTKKFYVPLGVGAHLNRWGVSNESIIEKNWWESDSSIEGIEIISTPARHFSGRGLNNRFSTLWCSWVLKTDELTVFFGGDSGYGKHFKEIGEKYGPFNLTMLECGAYNKNWPYIHSFPEETAQAHVDLKGEVLLPIHWAKFNLAMHPWKEPIQRFLKKSEELKLTVTTPLVGETIIYGNDLPFTKWWESIE